MMKLDEPKQRSIINSYIQMKRNPFLVTPFQSHPFHPFSPSSKPTYKNIYFLHLLLPSSTISPFHSYYVSNRPSSCRRQWSSKNENLPLFLVSQLPTYCENTLNNNNACLYLPLLLPSITL